MIRSICAGVAVWLATVSIAFAQAGVIVGTPSASGSGTVTSVACPSGTITTSGACNPLASAGTSGDLITGNGSSGVQDSGTALSALATLTGTQTLTNKTLTAPTLTAPLSISNGGTGTTTPGIVAGTNVTVSGSWPNQTVSAAGGTGTGCNTSGTAGQNLLDNGAGGCTSQTATQYATAIGAGSSGFSYAAPGTAGNVLTSNGSGAAPSFQAAAASGGAVFPASPPSGNWLNPSYTHALGTGIPVTANTIHCVPFFQAYTSGVNVKTLGARLTTAYSGGYFQLAVYANNPTLGRPTGLPLGYTASISTTTANSLTGVPVGGNFTMPIGLYWGCENTDNSSAAFQVAASDVSPMSAVGSATQSTISSTASNGVYYLSVAGTLGSTWPNLTGVSMTEVANASAAYANVQYQAN